MPDPYLYAYNCSSDPMSSVWQYNASSSPSQRQALSYRLQNAMCAEFLGASSCPSTGPVPPDPSSFEKIFESDFYAAALRSFCETFSIDKVSVLLYTIFASPAFAVFLVNAVVLALQYARKRRSRSACTAEEAAAADRSVGHVLGSLDAIEMHLNAPRSPEGNISTPPPQQLGAIKAASANLYGAFAWVLSLCCLRWTVGASHQRGRQLSRAFFSAFFICFTAIICRSDFVVFRNIVGTTAVSAFYIQSTCSFVNPVPSRPLYDCSGIDQAYYNFFAVFCFWRTIHNLEFRRRSRNLLSDAASSQPVLLCLVVASHIKPRRSCAVHLATVAATDAQSHVLGRCCSIYSYICPNCRRRVFS